MLTYTIIGLLAALALGALVMFHWLKERGETADAVRWAQRDAPLIFEQQAQGGNGYFKKQTIEQYEMALKLLDKYGNKLLDRKEDVYLWVHLSDAENGKVDFKEWQIENVKRREKIFEEHNLKKAKQAIANGKLLELAQMQNTEYLPLEERDFERNENGKYE